jgi:hypothetical protein
VGRRGDARATEGASGFGAANESEGIEEEGKEGGGSTGARQGEGGSLAHNPGELEEGAIQPRMRGGERQKRTKGRLPREIRGVEIREVEMATQIRPAVAFISGLALIA